MLTWTDRGAWNINNQSNSYFPSISITDKNCGTERSTLFTFHSSNFGALKMFSQSQRCTGYSVTDRSFHFHADTPPLSTVAIFFFFYFRGRSSANQELSKTSTVKDLSVGSLKGTLTLIASIPAE